MNVSIVNVLTPNGRRQNVKVQPNTTILKILEEVCQKHQFDPNEYDLKHHKRILDLTIMYRFSGLPNNAQLEMVDALKKRQDADVNLMVQLSDGTRLEGTFKPNETIQDIVRKLCPEKIDATDLVAIYMRTEILSNKLHETSLKDLGLVGGRAILRLVHREADAAKITANVPLILPVKPPTKPEDEEIKMESKKSKTEVPLSSNSILQSLRSERDATNQETSEKPQATEMEIDEEVSAQKTNEISSNSVGYRLGSAASVKPEPEPIEEDDIDDEEDVGVVNILGERNAVLFSLESSKMINYNDLPDSFFELSVNDIKLIIKELRAQGQGTTEQPLLTAQLRELEQSKEQMIKLNQYNKTIIRIQFSDKYVLQGTFTPYDTIETVMDFIRPYLISSDIDFILYTTPPKQTLSKDQRLFEANCVPTALLHFGTDDNLPKILKDEIVEKVSSPKASLRLALQDRGLNHLTKSLRDQSNLSESHASSSETVRKPNADSFRSSTASTSSEIKAPKWFKSIGK